MRLNARSCVRTKRLLLVPYEPRHVPRYHTWMQSEELRNLTASEPLSLEEEYAMQRSWREDADKLTFILLDRAIFETSTKADRELQAMIGDVNLFLHQLDNCAELEVMLAEPVARGKGLGREAALAMMLFACSAGALNSDIYVFSAKIGEDNTASLNLFTGLDFQIVGRSSIFKEVTLILDRAKFETRGENFRQELEFSVLRVEEVL